MRTLLLSLSFIIMISGCTHIIPAENKKAIDSLKAGATEQEVLHSLGTPDLRYDFGPGKFVYYYRTMASPAGDCGSDRSLCTPLSFVNGTLSVAGQDLMDQWEKERIEQQKRDQLARQEKLRKEKLALERQKAEIQRKKKIRALEKKVKPIPAARVALNLKLYRELLALDPDNPRYQKRVALYQERLEHKNRIATKKERMAARKRAQALKEEKRKQRNHQLRQYSGNENAEVAVHDMGNGTLYIWLKNVGTQTITSHPDYFTIVDQNEEKIGCRFASGFDAVIEPGDIAHGKVKCLSALKLKRLIFKNNEAGIVVKDFP